MERIRSQNNAPRGEDPQERDFGLLKVLSPSTARIFEELQNPNLTKEEFFKKIGDYNETIKDYRRPERKGQ